MHENIFYQSLYGSKRGYTNVYLKTYIIVYICPALASNSPRLPARADFDCKQSNLINKTVVVVVVSVVLNGTVG